MIAIIDYGVGNLRSVEKALHFLGYEAAISSDKDFIKSADAVLLPGVGAFADAMNNLKDTGMDKLVYDVADSGKPFLGICLGMQMLFDYSEEGGYSKGLGLIPGSVRRLSDELGLKVPHMGWNQLDVIRDAGVLQGLPEEAYVYFVHSYFVKAEKSSDVIATTHYGVSFDVAVNRGNIYGTQFHPEKSGDVGMKILDNFAKIVEGNGI